MRGSAAFSRPFTSVSKLDLYVEKQSQGEPRLEDFVADLRRQARLSGARAVVDVEWTLNGGSPSSVYHVTATGITWAETPAGTGGAMSAPGK